MIGRAIISHKNKYIYFYVPKVACTTTRALLAGLEGFKWHHPWVKEPAFNFLSLVNYNAKKYKDYFKFAFVRNPWDRLVSCYCEKVVGLRNSKNNKGVINGEYRGFKRRYGNINFKNMEFVDFAKFVSTVPDLKSDGHFRSQHLFLPVKDLDFLGKYEKFSTDLQIVKDKLGIKEQEGHFFKSGRSAYPGYYDEKSRVIIGNRYKKDIKLFNYTF